MAELREHLARSLRDRYRVERKLGEGGMATVWLAQDLKHGRPVALKVLRPEVAAALGSERFLHEIRVTATLQHPHILPLFDSGSDGGLLYYVMPFVDGESLRGRLDREHQLALPDALQIVRDVAEALDCAHRHGVLHRDVKPENILLAEGHAFVADFGVARAISRAASERTTGAGTIVGTPAYLSPEAASGAEEIDGRSDLYALGCVSYEMLAGQPPFAGPGPRAVIARHVAESPPPLLAARPDLPVAVGRAVEQALAKDPADRFATVLEFATALNTAPLTGSGAGFRSVAVLPFATVSSEEGNDYLAEGITDQIISALTRIEGLRVASRTSVFALRGRALDVRAIAERLNVETVLEGTLQRHDRQLRLTASLVDTANGYQLWSERYDREMVDVFAIQDGIARSIAGALRVILTERERRAMAPVPTADIRAYESYLRGRQFFHQTRKKSLEFAREMFTHAIEIDPGYAPAWAGIADCCSQLKMYYPGAEADLARADSASRKALELAPQLPEAHASRAFALWMLDRHAEATREFEAAIQLDPRQFDALYFYARSLFQHGEYEQAAALFQRAAAVRDDYQASFFAAQSLAALGREAEARAGYRQALRAAEDHIALNPDDPRAATMRAVSHCRLGEQSEGIRWAERALVIDPEDAGVLYNVACLYALEGLRDRAIDALEEALRRGFGNLEWISRDPDLDALHGDPRFQALMASGSIPIRPVGTAGGG